MFYVFEQLIGVRNMALIWSFLIYVISYWMLPWCWYDLAIRERFKNVFWMHAFLFINVLIFSMFLFGVSQGGNQ